MAVEYCSGKVQPMTVAPMPRSATYMSSRSVIVSSRSNEPNTSFAPAITLARSGSSPSAGSSWSARIRLVRRPLMARFA